LSVAALQNPAFTDDKAGKGLEACAGAMVRSPYCGNSDQEKMAAGQGAVAWDCRRSRRDYRVANDGKYQRGIGRTLKTLAVMS
jgi:hypothetical protein